MKNVKILCATMFAVCFLASCQSEAEVRLKKDIADMQSAVAELNSTVADANEQLERSAAMRQRHEYYSKENSLTDLEYLYPRSK